MYAVLVCDDDDDFFARKNCVVDGNKSRTTTPIASLVVPAVLAVCSSDMVIVFGAVRPVVAAVNRSSAFLFLGWHFFSFSYKLLLLYFNGQQQNLAAEKALQKLFAEHSAGTS